MGGKSDGSEAANQSNNLLKEEIATQKEQERLKLTALRSRELDTIKAQGGLNWNSKAPVNPSVPATNVTPATNPFNPWNNRGDT